MTFRKALLLGLTAVFLSSCAGSKSRLKVGESAEGEVVEAEGLAPNDAADLIGTKRASLVDAQKNAVEKAVGVFVSGRTLVEKAVAIENNILARTDGYIKKYDVLSEGPDGDLYKTRIRALVALKALEQDLKEMSLLNTPELTRPRVYVEVENEVDESALKDPVAASGIKRILSEQGFVVVESDRIKEADLVISGKASSYPFQSAGLGGFISYRARLSVDVARTGTKETILTLSREASGLGGNKNLAAMKSLEVVGELVGTEVAGKLPEAITKGKTALVFVENMATFDDVDRVRKHLASQPGVTDLMLRFYEENMAQFEVQLNQGTASDVAAALQKSRTVPLKVVEAKPQLLRLRLE